MQCHSPHLVQCLLTQNMIILIYLKIHPANHIYFLNKFIYFIYFYFWLCWVFVSAHELFSSCGERGLLFVAVQGLLIAVASLVVEHGL